MKNLFLPFLVILMTISNVFSQDLCTPAGWANHDGVVTGGGNATPAVVTNYTELKNAIQSSSVKVVHVSGTITIPSGGMISFQDQSDKTIFGLNGSKLVSTDLTSSGSGILYIKRCSNIIVRNMVFEGPGAYDVDGRDNVTIDNSTSVWVDHCEFRDGLDGNFDIKNQADLISVTWCKFAYDKAPIPDGPGGSDDHRFTNLIGSGDGATQDRGKLRITFQNCWWAPGCKARMPRVRFGQVHLVNNYFNSTASTNCIQAGFESNLLVEGNVFENVKNPIDLMNNTFTAVTERNNSFIGTTSGTRSGSGTAFTPPYSLSVAAPGTIVGPITSCAGATLPGPSACSSCGETGSCTPTTITPYVQVNGGSWNNTATATVDVGGSVKFGPQPVGGSWSWSGPNGFSASSREVTISSIQSSSAGSYVATYTNSDGCNSSQTFSVTVNGSDPAILEKHGSGSSSQTIDLGASIAGFYYDWFNANTVTVNGMPQGINVDVNNSAQTVSFSGTPTEAGTFNYTITTEGGNPEATISATITVVQSCTPTSITPYLQINGGSWSNTATATVEVGATVKFGPQPVSGSWSWSGPNGLSASTREVTISNIQTSGAGDYVATYTNSDGCTSSQTFSVTVNSNPAILEKHGSGSSSQTINLGESIVDFYYDWFNANTVTVSGMPQGINVDIDNTAQRVSFSGTPTQAGTFNYTITTEGGSPEATKSATITVNTSSSTARNSTTAAGTESEKVQDSEILEAYPNPFNQATTFKFNLTQKGHVSIDIYSTTGRHITEIVNNTFESGLNEIVFEKGSLESGIYIYILESEQGTLRKRLIIE